MVPIRSVSAELRIALVEIRLHAVAHVVKYRFHGAGTLAVRAQPGLQRPLLHEQAAIVAPGHPLRKRLRERLAALEQARQHDRILDRHGAALRPEGRAGMRGVAEHHDAALVPGRVEMNFLDGRVHDLLGRAHLREQLGGVTPELREPGSAQPGKRGALVPGIAGLLRHPGDIERVRRQRHDAEGLARAHQPRRTLDLRGTRQQHPPVGEAGVFGRDMAVRKRAHFRTDAVRSDYEVVLSIGAVVEAHAHRPLVAVLDGLHGKSHAHADAAPVHCPRKYLVQRLAPDGDQRRHVRAGYAPVARPQQYVAVPIANRCPVVGAVPSRGDDLVDNADVMQGTQRVALQVHAGAGDLPVGLDLDQVAGDRPPVQRAGEGLAGDAAAGDEDPADHRRFTPRQPSRYWSSLRVGMRLALAL